MPIKTKNRVVQENEKTQHDLQNTWNLCVYGDDISMIDVNIDRNVKRVESILGRAPRPVVAKHVNSFRYWMFQKQLDCASKKALFVDMGRYG